MSEQEAAAPVTASEPVVTSAPEPSMSDTMASVYDKHFPNERVARAESGKFESKTPPAETAVEADTTETTEINQEPVAEVTEPAKPAISRPQSWSADFDEKWASLAPELQEYIAKRETEATQAMSRLGSTAKQAEAFNAIFSRYGHVLNGNAPDKEVESLLATKDALIRNPEHSIQWLANELGVDLSKFAKTASGEQPAESEATRALQEQVAQLRRELGETRNNLSARERAEAQTREQSLQKLVEDHSKGKDYWGEIEAEVLNQVAAIRYADPGKDPKSVLEEAEKRAVKLNEAVANRLNEAKRKDEAVKKAAEDKRKADEAKKHAALNVKSSPGKSPSATKKDMWSEMSETYDRLAG